MKLADQLTFDDIRQADAGIISVTDLNRLVAETLRNAEPLKHVAVRGELSGFKDHIASGHWYFSLKDESSRIDCVMFRQNNLRVLFRPKDGDSVVLTGYIDFYTRDGRCQMYVSGMKPEGLGDLYVRFEELKRRLQAEGLFDESRKKPLPMVPSKVAVITSETGAAIHDICNVAANRHPGIPLVLIPVTVQGPGAAGEIASAIRFANTLPGVDVIIAGRGGGSPEDLWCFNEEIVARAIADSRIPVVSAVGHEIDFSISDFAADVRASTPSNAAEIVFPDRSELRARIRALKSGLDRAEGAKFQSVSLALAGTRTRLERLSPEKRLAALSQQPDILRQRLNAAISRKTDDSARALSETADRLGRATDATVAAYETVTVGLRERLNALSPMRVLERGYTMVYSTTGRLITTAASAGRSNRMSVRFRDASVNVVREDRQQ